MAALNARSLAYCGLALTGQTAAIDDATETLTRVRVATTAGGIVEEVRRLYAVLVAHDAAGVPTLFDDILKGSDPR